MLSTHIPFVPCQSAIPFLWYDFFKIWPLKPKVKVMVEVNVESHKVSVTSYQLTSLSFHVNRPFHSWDTKFPNLTLKIQVEAQMTMMTHNYRSRQFHITLSGINASSRFRDMASTKSSPSAASFEKFWTMGKPMWGNWANYYDSAQLQVYTSPLNFKWAKSIQQFQRSAFRKVWTQFVPNLTSFWSIGKPILGKWANDHTNAQLQALTIPQNFEQRISKLIQKYGFLKPGSRPPARTVRTIPLQSTGLRGKKWNHL